MLKKGSLQLSINAIVIIVLAMTLLGLGLGFIRNQFESIGDIGGDVQEQIRQQILEDLRTGDKKLSFPTSELKIGRRDDTVTAMGIKNVESKQINFGVFIRSAGGTGSLEVSDLEFRYQNESTGAAPYAFFLDPADATVVPVRIETGTQTGTNTYAITVEYALQSGCNPADPSEWCPESAPYAQKTFFLTVQ